MHDFARPKCGNPSLTLGARTASARSTSASVSPNAAPAVSRSRRVIPLQRVLRLPRTRSIVNDLGVPRHHPAVRPFVQGNCEAASGFAVITYNIPGPTRNLL